MTREELRAAMSPEAVQICDALLARFGAKPVYIETPTLKVGYDLETPEGQRKYVTKQSIAKFMESQSAIK